MENKNIAVVIENLEGIRRVNLCIVDGSSHVCIIKRYYEPISDSLQDIYKNAIYTYSDMGFFKMNFKEFIRKNGYYGYKNWKIKKAGLYEI